MMLPWSAAMRRAQYGPEGFYRRHAPGDHFRTSSQSPPFAAALAELVRRADRALGSPREFRLVDVGAGEGVLLHRILELEDLQGRLRPVGVDLRRRPEGLDRRLEWRTRVPARFTGVLLACELLDDVPCDVAVVDDDGRARLELVDPDSGDAVPGAPLEPEHARWLRRWWPLREPGERAEIGTSRDARWARLLRRLRRGYALAVDYGHVRDARPSAGTLAGWRDGRATPPRADGSVNLTAHVAMDSLGPGLLLRQREALLRLGVSARRPELERAARDPIGYVRALSRAGEAAEVLDPAGLGGHRWLLRGVGVGPRLLD